VFPDINWKIQIALFDDDDGAEDSNSGGRTTLNRTPIGAMANAVMASRPITRTMRRPRAAKYAPSLACSANST